MQANKDDEFIKDIFNRLGVVLKSTIEERRDLVTQYGPSEIKSILLERLDNEEMAVSSEIDYAKGNNVSL